MIFESYWVFKSLLERKITKSAKKKVSGEKLARVSRLFRFSWLVWVLVLVLILRLTDFSQNWLSLINASYQSPIPFGFFVILAVFFWFWVEGLSFEKGKETILFQLLNNRWLNFWSAILAALVASFIFEFYNSFLRVWVYAN